MQGKDFYQKYSELALSKRFILLSNDFTDILNGKTLNDVYQEIKAIDDKIRPDIIRKQKLVEAVDKFIK